MKEKTRNSITFGLMILVSVVLMGFGIMLMSHSSAIVSAALFVFGAAMLVCAFLFHRVKDDGLPTRLT